MPVIISDDLRIRTLLTNNKKRIFNAVRSGMYSILDHGHYLSQLSFISNVLCIYITCLPAESI